MRPYPSCCTIFGQNLPIFTSGALTPRPPAGSNTQAAGAKSLKLLDYCDGDRRPCLAPECPFLNSRHKPAEPHSRSNGPLRRFLRLIVEVDESRRWSHRLRAALLLLLLLVAFGLVGYWVPELLQRHLR